MVGRLLRCVPWGAAREARRRGIFRYWDGGRWRLADPSPLFRALEQAGGPNWADLFDTAMAPAGDPEDRAAAGRELVKLGRAVFGVPPAAGRRAAGLTDPEVIDLLVAFLAFCKALGDREPAGPADDALRLVADS